MKHTGEEPCPFKGAFELLGRRHSLEILWSLQQKRPRRFTEIKRALGVNPVTLTERLTDLEAFGVVERRAYRETPPRVDYDLTKKGVALLGVIDHLASWSKEHPTRALAR